MNTQTKARMRIYLRSLASQAVEAQNIQPQTSTDLDALGDILMDIESDLEKANEMMELLRKDAEDTPL